MADDLDAFFDEVGEVEATSTLIDNATSPNSKSTAPQPPAPGPLSDSSPPARSGRENDARGNNAQDPDAAAAASLERDVDQAAHEARVGRMMLKASGGAPKADVEGVDERFDLEGEGGTVVKIWTLGQSNFASALSSIS